MKIPTQESNQSLPKMSTESFQKILLIALVFLGLANTSLVAIVFFGRVSTQPPITQAPVNQQSAPLFPNIATPTEMTHNDALDSIVMRIIQAEGGYNPEDSPPSYAGIILCSWNRYASVTGEYHTLTDVRQLENNSAGISKFYHWYIGVLSGALDVPVWFAYPLADFYVESGGWAIKVLQRKSGAHPDGVWGPETHTHVAKLIRAAEQNNMRREFIQDYTLMRINFIKRLDLHYETSVINRIKNVEKVAIQYVDRYLATKKSY